MAEHSKVTQTKQSEHKDEKDKLFPCHNHAPP